LPRVGCIALTLINTAAHSCHPLSCERRECTNSLPLRYSLFHLLSISLSLHAQEKKKSILKRVCDVCTVSTCLVLNKDDLGQHESGIMMTYSEQGEEKNVTLATG